MDPAMVIASSTPACAHCKTAALTAFPLFEMMEQITAMAMISV
jgi:hypothetical protein